jgi:hypothetical protein
MRVTFREPDILSSQHAFVTESDKEHWDGGRWQNSNANN